MDELKITSARRDVLGKRNRFLLRSGVTPAHLFGRNIDSQTLQVSTAELVQIISRAGTTLDATRALDADVYGRTQNALNTRRALSADEINNIRTALAAREGANTDAFNRTGATLNATRGIVLTAGAKGSEKIFCTDTGFVPMPI